MTTKLILSEEIQKIKQKLPKQGPGFFKKAIKAFGQGLSYVARKIKTVLSSGAFWVTGLFVALVYTCTGALKQEHKRDQKFLNEVKTELSHDGYRILDAKTVSACGCSGQKVKLPDTFEKAAVITVRRNDSISDLTVVREAVSATGYQSDRIFEKKFIKVDSKKGLE